MLTTEIKAAIKKSKKLLADDKFVAFAGVATTTVNKKLFTDVLKSHNKIFKTNVIVEWPGLPAETIFAYSKKGLARASIYIQTTGASEATSDHISVTFGTDGDLPIFNTPEFPIWSGAMHLHLKANESGKFNLAMLKINSILQELETLVEAHQAVQNMLKLSIEMDQDSPLKY
jgi:hypothetical protein